MKGRIFNFIAVVAILSTFAMSQTAPPARFEVADIHASARGLDMRIEAAYRRSGRYELHNATMLDLIRTAYSVDADNVVGGPNWLELDRFDLIAKVPSNTPAKNLNATSMNDQPRGQAILNKYLLPKLPHVRAKDVMRAQIRSILEKIAKDAPIMANRVLASFRKMYTPIAA